MTAISGGTARQSAARSERIATDPTLPSVVSFAYGRLVPEEKQQAEEAWTDGVANAIGRRITRYRRRRGLTVQQLSDAMTEAGVSLKRPVLSNLENGYRRTVTVAEVLALASVLRVSPLLLIVPIGEEPDFEILPGVKTATWAAAEWVTGEGPPLTGNGDELWRKNVDLLTLYRQHTRVVAEHKAEQQEARRGFVGDNDEEVTRMLGRSVTRRRELEENLRLIRRSIRERGDIPPELPPEWPDLDREDHR
jgi:transcriptional regulator with XRE-family HTH domain